MNWDAISAISETLGAAAVVVSLIYLATQVRSSSKATRASMHIGLHASYSQLDSLLISDPDLLELFDRASAGDPELTTADQARISRLLANAFNGHELFFFLNREGMFTPDVERAMSRVIINRLKSPGVKAWWHENQEYYSDEFAKWIEEKCTRN